VTYPDLAQVEAADHMTLARWMRHLPSPGMNVAGTDEYIDVMEREAAISERIAARFDAMGGWNPALSKAVGW